MRPANPDLQDPAPAAKDPDDATDSVSSGEGAAKDDDDEEKQPVKPTINAGHADRIRMRQRRSKGRKGSVKSLRGKKDSLGKKGKKIRSFDSAKTGDSLSQDLSLSLSFDTDDDKKGASGQGEGKGEVENGEGEMVKPKRRVGMIRRLPPISGDQVGDEDTEKNDKEEEEEKQE